MHSKLRWTSSQNAISPLTVTLTSQAQMPEEEALKMMVAVIIATGLSVLAPILPGATAGTIRMEA